MNNGTTNNGTTNNDIAFKQIVSGNDNTVNGIQNTGNGNLNIGSDVNIYMTELSRPDRAMGVEEQLSFSADLHNQGLDEEALSFLNECLANDGLDEETRAAFRFNRGICNFCLKNYSVAIEDFKYAAQISNNPDAYWNLAEAYMMSGRYAQASDSYNWAYAALKDSQNSDEKKQTIMAQKELADIMAANNGQ